MGGNSISKMCTHIPVCEAAYRKCFHTDPEVRFLCSQQQGLTDAEAPTAAGSLRTNLVCECAPAARRLTLALSEEGAAGRRLASC